MCIIQKRITLLSYSSLVDNAHDFIVVAKNKYQTIYRFYKTQQGFNWYKMMSFNISLTFLMIPPKLTPFLPKKPQNFQKM